MATVVNVAFPAATTSADGNIQFKQSIADPQIDTINTGGTVVITGSFPATDDRDADTPDYTP